MRNINDLPLDLPKPTDDGAAAHLTEMEIPFVELLATNGKRLDLSEIAQEPTVLFIYPRAGSPIEPNSNPDLWDQIPGARGCTPQSCGFRDHQPEFTELGYSVYGLSSQSPRVQKEFVGRNEIFFPVLSDEKHELAEALRLPTFEFEGERLLKRMALVLEAGKIKKVFYPVFPPDKNAEDVLAWLRAGN